jgi:hypothetical protein
VSASNYFECDLSHSSTTLPGDDNVSGALRSIYCSATVTSNDDCSIATGEITGASSGTFVP